VTSTLPRLSVVIPAYNRLEPLKYTLRSVARAASVLGAAVDVQLVDDGSDPPIADRLRDFEAGLAVTHIRQANQGSIVARLAGLAGSRGAYVLFLDSDDLVHPDKFVRQLGLMQETGADVSYADMGAATLGPGYTVASFELVETLEEATGPAHFFISVQAAPHSPIYRRGYLQQALASPLVPALRAMDPSGDVWLYYNLVVFPARIVKANGPLSAPGPHDEDRYSRHWENLGLASLQIMEAFMRACPPSPSTAAARQAVGEAAFRAWRRLPRGFHRGFARRMLKIYEQAPHGELDRLGTPSFERLARCIGPLPAARLLRACRGRPYSRVRTLSVDAYNRLFADFERPE